jgi:hypothetical protein
MARRLLGGTEDFLLNHSLRSIISRSQGDISEEELLSFHPIKQLTSKAEELLLR